jgi:hypothetical protein
MPDPEDTVMTPRGTTKRHHRRSHRIAALVAAGVTATAATAFGAAGVAHAAGSTTCAGNSSISYSPGLTFTPRPVQYAETDTFDSCVSTDPSLTGGTSFAGVSLSSASCLGVPGVFEDPSYTIDWNDGRHSVVALTFTDVIVAGTEQVTGTGTVTSGLFQGGNATIVWLYPVLNPLQCASSQGVTSQSGPVVAQITTL